MPAFFAALSVIFGNLVKSQIGFWIAAALTAFGLQLVTQNLVVDPIIGRIQSTMSGMGADALAWMAFLRVDDGIMTLLSAYAAASVMSGIRMTRKATP